MSTVVDLPEYPKGLPQKPLLDSYDEKFPSTLKVVTPANKMAITRQTSSRMIVPMGVSFVYDEQELTIFEDFFNITLGHGIRRFTFTHPRTLEPIECSIVPQGEVMVDIKPFGKTLSYQVSFNLWIWT